MAKRAGPAASRSETNAKAFVAGSPIEFRRAGSGIADQQGTSESAKPCPTTHNKGKATTVREYIMESILTPSAYVVKPFPDNIMPKDFGKKLNAAALNKIINYLSQLEEGKPPPKIE